MCSRYPFTDEILKEDVGIMKMGHRERVLGKLSEDLKVNIRDKLVEGSGPVSCELCRVF